MCVVLKKKKKHFFIFSEDGSKKEETYNWTDSPSEQKIYMNNKGKQRWNFKNKMPSSIKFKNSTAIRIPVIILHKCLG